MQWLFLSQLIRYPVGLQFPSAPQSSAWPATARWTSRSPGNPSRTSWVAGGSQPTACRTAPVQRARSLRWSFPEGKHSTSWKTCSPTPSTCCALQLPLAWAGGSSLPGRLIVHPRHPVLEVQRVEKMLLSLMKCIISPKLRDSVVVKDGLTKNTWSMFRSKQDQDIYS